LDFFLLPPRIVGALPPFFFFHRGDAVSCWPLVLPFLSVKKSSRQVLPPFFFSNRRDVIVQLPLPSRRGVGLFFFSARAACGSLAGIQFFCGGRIFAFFFSFFIGAGGSSEGNTILPPPAIRRILGLGPPSTVFFSPSRLNTSLAPGFFLLPPMKRFRKICFSWRTVFPSPVLTFYLAGDC